MKAYHHNLVPLLIDLAKKARAQDEEWVQRSILALTFSDEPGLAYALSMRLKLMAVIEELDPFPFDIPSEEDFI